MKTQTGGVDLSAIHYTYGDTGPRLAHQIEVASFGGWGAVLSASYTGKARDATPAP